MLLIKMDSSLWPEAIALARRAVAIEEKLHADVDGVHEDVAICLSNLARTLKRVDVKQYLAEAIILQRRALAIHEQLHARVNGAHPAVARALNNLAHSLQAQTKPDFVEAENLCARALDIQKRIWEHADALHPAVGQERSISPLMGLVFLRSVRLYIKMSPKSLRSARP
jgi:hypothetical protein